MLNRLFRSIKKNSVLQNSLSRMGSCFPPPLSSQLHCVFFHAQWSLTMVLAAGVCTVLGGWMEVRHGGIRWLSGGVF